MHNPALKRRLWKAVCLSFKLICIAVIAATSEAQLVVESSVFHRATNTGIEGGSQDNGGAIFLFVRNTGTTSQTFTQANVSINGTNVNSLGNYDWSRVWPLTVAPGEVTTLTVKGNAGPFQEGSEVNVQLQANSGLTVNHITTLTTPKLRIGNIIPSQDLTKSYIYLRNDDSISYAIDKVLLNDDVTSASRFVGDSTTIAPNSVKILEVHHSETLPLLTPIAARVEARRADNNQMITTGAPVRLTEPRLPTATWGSGAQLLEEKMETARLQYGHDLIQSSIFQRLQTQRYEKYYMQGLNIDMLDFVETSPGVYDLNQVTGPAGSGAVAPLFSLPAPLAERANDPSVGAWLIEDEPDLDLNDAHRNPQAMWRLNETFWRNSDKPTSLNLVHDRHVQRYGLITDHPSIDHYLQYAPLNYFSFSYPIDQALQYAESMKNNVEPLRMWWTPQGVSPGTWGTQPTDWGIAVQFWSAIMGGSKGLVGFKFSDVENEFPVQHARQVDLLHELQIVENLVLYGETLNNVSVNQPAADAQARSIISEHAVVLPVANVTGNYSLLSGVSFNTLNNVVVNVTIPDWISIDQVARVTADGFQQNVNYLQNGQQITITIDQLRDTEVFVISEADSAPPEAITGLQRTIRDSSDPFYQPTPAGQDFLSWREPFDNFGVHGYKVFENQVLIGDVPTPAFTDFTFSPFNNYSVQAYDASGNLGPVTMLPAEIDIADRLAGYWRFDGNIRDDSGNGNHGTIRGQTTYSTDVPAILGHGNSLSIAAGDGAIVPDSDSLDFTDALTISVWIKSTDNAQWGMIVNKGPEEGSVDGYAGNYEFRREANSARLGFLYEFNPSAPNTFYQIFSNDTVNLNEWTHVAVTVQQSGDQVAMDQVRLYINGALDSETLVVGALNTPFLTNDEPLRIGFRKDGLPFIGFIDELSIWDIALPPDAIAQLAAAEIDLSQGLSGDFDGDGDVDGKDFLAWQRGESPIPLSPLDLANWQLNYGETSTGLSASVVVPEPKSLSQYLVFAFFLSRRASFRKTRHSFSRFFRESRDWAVM